jgi:tetraacyldisaccharide 4'-kinase
VYAAAARRRRERYAARPDLRRRLRRPVISIGNLAVGGRGKTPLVMSIARMLLDAGECPAILSRGYARTRPADGVIIVRDRDDMRADLASAGDEPLMLARRLPGACVVVGSDRYLAGRLAEHHLGATVHVLDDGFQHVQLDRDVDIVAIAPEDIRDTRTLPAGRLREPPDVMLVADAVLIMGAEPDVLGDPVFEVFRVRKTVVPPVVDGEAGPVALVDLAGTGCAVLALAGIAQPTQFFDDLRAMSLNIADTVAVRDHHAYSAKEVDRLTERARACSASAIVTTEKDYVRLLPFRPFGIPIAYAPLTMEPDPEADFRQWLAGSLRGARDIA